MKKMKKLWLHLLLMLIVFSSCNNERKIADYQVIPLPVEISMTKNSSFIINPSTRILYVPGNELLKRNADFLTEYIAKSTGYKLAVAEGTDGENTIALKADLKDKNREAYKLIVNQNNVVINGASEQGNFYGIQTLRKSIPAKANGMEIELPTVEIYDFPRFGYRGFHLDVARHFMPVEDVKKFIDILALHNENRFHWHLTDDQGWRIEIKKYPLLTEVGSKRSETVIGHNSGKYDGTPYEGFYTQDQIRGIVKYAQERYITIIPEIDMPGHMLGALTAYPVLGCTGGSYKVWTQWGVSDEVLCAGKEITYEFVENVLTEIMELFPSQYIHIGGDECPKTVWKTCSACQARIKAEGLDKDEKHSPEEKLQSYFISRIEKFINSKGRRIIGWDEILEGGLAPDATVMSWRGIEGGIQAAKEGHDAIMTPSSHLYFDYYQSTDTKNEPIAIGGYLPVERVYSYEPIADVLTPEEALHIVGVQANLWTEYIPDFNQVMYMMMPRIAALCEVQWTDKKLRNYNQFITRLPQLIYIYDAEGYNYAKHLFDVSAQITPNADKGVLEVTFSTLMGGDIYYTLDGSEPNEKSTKYVSTLALDKEAIISACVIRPTGKSRVFTETVSFNKASLKPITLLHNPSPGYTYKGAGVLVDGLKGGLNYKTGRWLGFQSDDLEAIIDLKQETEIHQIKLSANVVKGDWIMGMTRLAVSVSLNGTDYTEVSAKDYAALEEKDTDRIYDYELSFEPKKTRYVKVVAKRTPVLPDWHSGKGAPAFLFVDEIGIY